MELSPEIITVGVELATIAGRMSVEAIFDRIRAVKQNGNKDEIIGNLEEIINELISDKNHLIQISQAYKEYLIAQQITENEIDYITDSIVPLLEDLIEKTESDESGRIQAGIDIVKSLLSKETFNIMQILGFNFKKAVGEPLTELTASLIRSKMNTSDLTLEVQLLAQQREVEYLKVCQNEEAFNRFMSIYQRSE